MMAQKATNMLIIATVLMAFSSATVFANVWPISGSNSTPDDLTSEFGSRVVDYQYDFHRGVDIHTGGNKSVYAVKDGTIK